MKLFFFTSSVINDEISRLTIRTSSRKRAFGYALVQFTKHGCKGSPIELAI